MEMVLLSLVTGNGQILLMVEMEMQQSVSELVLLQVGVVGAKFCERVV